MRPGRLDRIRYVGPPDREAREDKDEINDCWKEVDVRVITKIVSLVPQSFLINNPLPLIRLKDVPGCRSQRPARKPLFSQCRMT